MGLWYPATAAVGERQRWAPDFPGDWPKDPDPRSPDFRLGILPPPCPTCGGELWRWVGVSGGITDEHWARVMRHWEKAGSPLPAPVREMGTEVRRYELRCYREAHFRSSAASTEGIDLKPHRRV